MSFSCAQLGSDGAPITSKALLVVQFYHFAASSFQMTHQVYACLRPFLFFFEVFLESNFFDTVVVLDDERIPFSLIFRVLAGQIIVAQEAAFQLLFGCASSVLAWCASTVQAHRTLGIGEPF